MGRIRCRRQVYCRRPVMGAVATAAVAPATRDSLFGPHERRSQASARCTSCAGPGERPSRLCSPPCVYPRPRLYRASWYDSLLSALPTCQTCRQPSDTVRVMQTCPHVVELWPPAERPLARQRDTTEKAARRSCTLLRRKRSAEPKSAAWSRCRPLDESTQRAKARRGRGERGGE